MRRPELRVAARPHHPSSSRRTQGECARCARCLGGQSLLQAKVGRGTGRKLRTVAERTQGMSPPKDRRVRVGRGGVTAGQEYVTGQSSSTKEGPRSPGTAGKPLPARCGKMEVLNSTKFI